MNDHLWRPFNLQDRLGKPILVYFEYTYCPDICPATLVQVRQIVDELGLGMDDYPFVMVIVNPEKNTPQLLEKYLNRYPINQMGLWGSSEQLKTVLDSYGVYAEKHPSED